MPCRSRNHLDNVPLHIMQRDCEGGRSQEAPPQTAFASRRGTGLMARSLMAVMERQGDQVRNIS